MEILARSVCIGRLAFSALFFSALFGASSLAFGGSSVQPPKAEDFMEELKRLYQTEDTEHVIDRLAAESEASRLAGIARELLGEAYAGSWFDAERMGLVVGTTDASKSELLERLGIHTMQMSQSLSALKAVQKGVLSDFRSAGVWGELAHSLYIDYPANAVVISTAPGSEDTIQHFLRAELLEGSLRIETSPGRDVLVGWSVRGADEYTNDVFDAQTSYDFKCSIGFSVVGGYLTAGHCGDQGNQVSGYNGSIQGAFSHSIVGGSGNKDRARVSTNQNWTPSPWVNGYSDGLINVPAKWAALKEYPLYSTVCRYGQASDSSNCGTITQSSVMVSPDHPITGQTYTITELKRTSACVFGGDSGGPFLSAGDSQAQGITLTATNSACSSDPSIIKDATFDPVSGPLTAFNSVMLTAHGANPPTLSNYRCPDMDNSGQGTYVCQIDHFNAQGETGLQWSSNTGHSSQSVLLYGTCSSGQWVSVSLDLTNVYGNVQQNSGFSCPTGPIP